jgi:hypothetical protein
VGHHCAQLKLRGAGLGHLVINNQNNSCLLVHPPRLTPLNILENIRKKQEYGHNLNLTCSGLEEARKFSINGELVIMA